MRKTIAIVFLAVLAAVSAAAQSREARTIKYAAKDIVLIKAKLRYTTLIVLPQNEKILDFVTGDKDFWVVEGTQNFCYIKPAKQGSNTDVTLITAAGNVYSFLVKEVGESDDPDLKVFIEPKDQSIVQAMNAPPKFVPLIVVELPTTPEPGVKLVMLGWASTVNALPARQSRCRPSTADEASVPTMNCSAMRAML